MEVAFVPTEHERSEGGAALGKLVVDGRDVKDGMWKVLRPRGPVRVTPGSVAPTSIFICRMLGASATA
jgi:hypothetical protein